jgi:hypothetical protein
MAVEVRYLCLLATLLAGSTGLLAARQSAPDAPAPAVDFARDIQPIFESRCYECHGPKKARGSLRLDDPAEIREGGMSGPAVTAGDSEQSVLVRRLLGLDGEDRMPLDEDPLPEAEIALIRRWIDEGAALPGTSLRTAAEAPRKHWAYIAPRRPAPPAVHDRAWVRTPIDQFVLARLEAERLRPSPEADRAALLRRVSLDLIGLPPTPADIDAFLADSRADAYERVVDHLLASPHYGERWARPWLDLARYADSHGYEKDGLRTMWKYRDWVIEALNRDMPFDRFTIEQIAGDMLPDATDTERIATGFHRNTLLNQEGGIDVEEARWETLVDRVNTTATVWLGSTIACAQCHNHKYDPFSQRDYYRLLAFFDNVEYRVHGRPGGDHWIAEPELDLPTKEQAARLEQLKAELDDVKKRLAAPSAEVGAAQGAWERQLAAAEAGWQVLRPAAVKARRGTVLTPQEDGSVLASGPAPVDETYVVQAPVPAAGISAIRLEVLPDPSLPQGGPGRDYYGNFVLTAFRAEVGSGTSSSASGPTGTLAFAAAEADDWTSGQKPGMLLEPYDDTGRTRDMPPGWAIDATRDDTRLRRQAVFTLSEPLPAAAGQPLTISLSFGSTVVSQAIGRFRLSVTTSEEPLQVLSVKPRAWPLLAKAEATRTPAERQALAGYYRAQAPALAPLRERAAALEQEIKDLGIVSALVMRERPSHERPSTPFRERGSFLAKGEPVYAGTPAVLPPMGDEEMPNRLGLARWLVSRENPLTARVTVNRAWEQFFGRGLVETSEDFGTQGAEPTHPELLDWLATELVRQKWSMKGLHRLIVTSATYRQSAAATPALAERDPYNRLLARGPRMRMEAEMLRDVALAASGLLSRRIGGPSVFPPQPDGIWDNPYSDEKWVPSEGEDRYRRGLYTFIRRTSPYPSLMVFDATSREVCTVRRARTNTPLQALTLLNDDAFFEAARALAARMLTEGGADAPVSTAGGQAPERRVAAYGFRLATARWPTPRELDRLVTSYERQLAAFRKRPANAARVTTMPAETPQLAERAAWTMVANALLNLDETVTK